MFFTVLLAILSAAVLLSAIRTIWHTLSRFSDRVGAQMGRQSIEALEKREGKPIVEIVANIASEHIRESSQPKEP